MERRQFVNVVDCEADVRVTGQGLGQYSMILAREDLTVIGQYYRQWPRVVPAIFIPYQH